MQGDWNECEKSDKGFVTALKHLCKANVMSMRALVKELGAENVTFIQSESSEYYHVNQPDAQTIEDFHNERRFLSLDLSYGNSVGTTMYQYLTENGMTRAEYAWFLENKMTNSRCIMGNDYYEWNEHIVSPDGSVAATGPILGYYYITHQYFDRYRLPVMHTETNVMDPDAAPGWLQREWTNVRALCGGGVPIVGFTWYSLTDQVDWDTGLTKDQGHHKKLGPFDLDRKIRPVGKAYRKLIKDWQPLVDMEVFRNKFSA